MKRPWIGVGASAIGYSLAAPPLGCWPLSFVWLAPLLVALRGRSIGTRTGLSSACLAGAGLIATAIPLTRALANFFDVSVLVCLPMACGIGLLFGGVAGLVFGSVVGDPDRQPSVILALRAGGGFVAGEELRTFFLTGLPWLELGHLLAPVPALAQHASLGGTRLVSFGLILGSVAVFALAIPGRRRQGFGLLAAVALLHLGSMLSMPTRDPVGRPGDVHLADVEISNSTDSTGQAIRFALVQPGLARDVRRESTRIPEILDRVVELTRSAGRVDLAVWPENVVPAFLPANEALVVDALGSLLGTTRNVVLGAPRSSPGGAFFNSAFLYSNANLVAFHDKVHPVPFTESVPEFARGRWHRAVDLTAGADVSVLPAGNTLLGPLICYELLFAEIAIAQVRAGAEVLLNISHDGYFGGTWGARQHLLAAPLRAIEMRRPLLRSTSDGVTVAVDHAGRIVGRVRAKEPAVLTVDVWPSQRQTLFVRTGRSFALVVSGLALLFASTDVLRTFRT